MVSVTATAPYTTSSLKHSVRCIKLLVFGDIFIYNFDLN